MAFDKSNIGKDCYINLSQEVSTEDSALGTIIGYYNDSAEEYYFVSIVSDGKVIKVYDSDEVNIIEEENSVTPESIVDAISNMTPAQAVQTVQNLGVVECTAENIVAATSDMTSEQQAATRQNIGADTPTTVTKWLNEHVDPESGYVIDNTLTIQGAAADAKKVGDAFNTTNTSFAVMNSSMFVWEMRKGIGGAGYDVTHNGIARTPHFPVSAGVEIQGLCATKTSNNIDLTLFVCAYKNGVFFNRTALSYGEKYIVPNDVTSLRFTYGGASSSGLKLTKDDLTSYFAIKCSLWDNAWKVVDRPCLVAFGASTTDATVHHYDGEGGATPSTIAFPEYVASCLGLKCCNLGVGTTGFLSRSSSGRLKNFMDQIYDNDHVLSKASVVVLMFGYGNDSRAGLPIGVYTDYYPYDAEGYHPAGAAGVETMLSKGVTLMGALNWCIKWLNEHYPMAQVIPIFGAPSANDGRTVAMTAQTEGPGVAPYTLTYTDPYDENGTTTNKKIKQISEELAKLKAALNIPIVDMFFDGGAFSWWSTYATRSVTIGGQDYTEYAIFSTTGTPANPKWNSHPNEDGYLAYSRILAGRIAGLTQYRY